VSHGGDANAPADSGAASHEKKSSEELIPVVGLGASAGGLIALEQFFANVPVDPGVAFVVVSHQHAEHPSLLHELLGRKTAMPVHLLTDASTIEPGHVYVAPPGRVLAIFGNRLHPTEPDGKAPRFLPIDTFFRSLAEDRKDRAIGIILSGTGADGTLGVKEIKAALGMVMVQDDATYGGMPHSAIQTGVVDYELPAAEMPAQLLGYLQGADRISSASMSSTVAQRVFDGIFLLLRRHTGIDFSNYKLSTIERRIDRRMNVRRVVGIPAYLELLREYPEELDALFCDLLIGVTSFFRDPEAFEVLALHLAELIDAKDPARAVRVWVPGCSTGEEAYSIAMLLCEYMDQRKTSLEVQIFATDVDADAVDYARRGVYPVGIAHHVSPDRLARFFTVSDELYRIKKEVRELVVFSQQNLIGDPPFIKLDLLSCRNLLIYLNTSVQQRLLPMFQYALRPGGILLLGSSESLGGFASSFETLDKKWKLFRRTDVVGPHFVSVSTLSLKAGQVPSVGSSAAVAIERPTLPTVPTVERLLLQELVPPTVIVTERGEVVHVHGRTGRFLEPAQGPQQAASIFDMAREGLRLELSAAIRQVSAQSENEVVRRDVHVGSGADTLLVDVRVKRVRDSDRFRNLLLITFERARPLPDGTGSSSEAGTYPDRVVELERELQHAKESHQGTIEELETSNEELKSTNEELQSTNEELQSANEELETSKEEMQSLNEELQTVNAELQGKIEELSRANDDMKNLLNGTDIATLFLDLQLNIMRYTEQAKHVFRLIPSDVGRPISDLVSRLRYDRLAEDAHEVLRTLVFKETEVRAQDGGWYLMRILPYRTIDNVIDGLVITFVDITKSKALQHGEARLNRLLRTSPTAILGQDPELRYVWVSGTAFGLDVAVGDRDTDLFSPGEAERLTAIKRSVIETGKPRREVLTLTVNDQQRTYDIYLQPLQIEGEGPTELASIATDITHRTHEP
jgi:two-component system CheB/CheR fusion protein